ncbi:hypothetical protein [Oryza sativa Japonica Group]|uniref:Uncharacterized protein n=1 Tax=Oryza sativa subsp. japonica TaxID=39947 RepID=Q5JL79_ORYSJ|nr:hypothetical protein [Oryza sativa Japonica Group]
MAASGDYRLLQSVRNVYAMGKGGFVLWQMAPDMWYVELPVGGSKVRTSHVLNLTPGTGGGEGGGGGERKAVARRWSSAVAREVAASPRSPRSSPASLACRKRRWIGERKEEREREEEMFPRRGWCCCRTGIRQREAQKHVDKMSKCPDFKGFHRIADAEIQKRFLWFH